MDIMEMLKTRRTYRRFQQERPVPANALADILLAQRYASSAANAQQLHYLVVQTPEVVEQLFPLTKWAAKLPRELGTPKEGEHPTLYILVLYEKDKKNKGTDTDAGLAISNMTLAAWSHGVGSCIMDNILREEIQTLLHIDAKYAIHSAVAFGYPTHQSYIVEIDPEAETDAKRLAYYLDEQSDYCVPKRAVADVVEYR